MARERKKKPLAKKIRPRCDVRTLKRQMGLENARLRAEVACVLSRWRIEAGLTQAQLAKRVGTARSVISRMENPKCDGKTFTMLSRISFALDKRMCFTIRELKGRLSEANAT